MSDCLVSASDHKKYFSSKQGSRPRSFAIGDRVRYRPGTGTYGYEDRLEADGRVPAVVIGFTRTRVTVQFTFALRSGNRFRSVDARSLEKAS